MSAFHLAQTTFYLASCSKAFLSAAMGILMDDFAHGRNVTALPSGVDVFDWDTKIKDLLGEEWVLMDEGGEQGECEGYIEPRYGFVQVRTPQN